MFVPKECIFPTGLNAIHAEQARTKLWHPMVPAQSAQMARQVLRVRRLMLRAHTIHVALESTEVVVHAIPALAAKLPQAPEVRVLANAFAPQERHPVVLTVPVKHVRSVNTKLFSLIITVSPVKAAKLRLRRALPI